MAKSTSLELGLPGKPACPNNYTSASELQAGGSTRLRIQSSAAGIYLSFGEGIGGIIWGPDEFFYPTIGTLYRTFDAVKVRNAIAGELAQVVLTAQ